MNNIDFESELYNQFGQVKDFSCGMRIARYFYEMGRKHQRDGVWHDVREEPKVPSRIVTFTGLAVDAWDYTGTKYCHDVLSIQEGWAYLEDILPT